MSFYTDAMSDMEFTRGVIKIKIAQCEYVRGQYTVIGYYETQLTTEKSIQPLDPEDIQKYGLGEYGLNEYYELYTLKEIPIPDADLKNSIISFNGKQYTIKKVMAWKWDGEETIGYYDYIICRKVDQLNGVNE